MQKCIDIKLSKYTMYLFQTHLKEKVSIYKTLSKIIGIGGKMATQTCDRLGISKHATLDDLSSFQLIKLTQIVPQSFLINDEYRVFTAEKIKRLVSISCFRGFRHLEGLPCRGQRTHTNACTTRKRKHNTYQNKTKINRNKNR